MDQTTGEMNRSERSDVGTEVRGADDDVLRTVGPDDETDRLKADIEDTRAEMGHTINEIQARLSPEHIMEQVKGSVRDATIGKVEKAMKKVGEKISEVADPALDVVGKAGTVIKETGSSVTQSVRQNPIPAALIGLGVGMLIMNRWRASDSRSSRLGVYGKRSDEGVLEIEEDFPTTAFSPTQQAKRRMQSRSDQTKGTARNIAAGARGSLTNIRDWTMEGTSRVGRGLQRMASENPLAIGAAAVAVGAAVGLAFPTTQLEEEYMGEVSDKLRDKTKQVVRETIDKVEVATTQAAGAGE